MPDKNEIKRIARKGLSKTASYEDEKHKLSSRGVLPDFDDYFGSYLDWVNNTIQDFDVAVSLYVAYRRFIRTKPTRDERFRFISNEKKRVIEDPTIIKKSK